MWHALSATRQRRPDQLLNSLEKRLQALCREAERVGWSLARLEPERVTAAVDVATRALSGVPYADVVDAFTSREGLRMAFVRVYGMMLRELANGSGGGAACLNLRLTMDQLLATACTSSKPAGTSEQRLPALLRTSLALLRADMLQALACVTDADLQRLRAAGGGGDGSSSSGSGGSGSDSSGNGARGGGSTDAAGAGNAQARAAHAAADADAAASLALARASRTAIAVQSVMSPLHMEAGSKATSLVQALHWEVRAALVRSLHASALLEHLCRLRLDAHALQRRLHDTDAALPSARGRNAADVTDEGLHEVLDCLVHSVSVCGEMHKGSRAGGGSSAAELQRQLLDVLTAPCVQMYGLWQLAACSSPHARRLLSGVPAYLAPLRELPASNGVHTAAALGFNVAWAARAAGASGTAALGRLAVTPAQLARLLCAVQAEGPELDAHLGSPAFAFTLGMGYMLLLHVSPGAIGLQQGNDAALLRAMWPVAVRGLRLLGDGLASIFIPRLLRIRLPSDCGMDSPPSEPPLSLRCALHGGLLRSLERGLRLEARVGALSPPCKALCNFMLAESGAWPSMLAHGTAAEVAALAVTLGKRIASKTDQGFYVLCLLEQTAAALAYDVPVAGTADTPAGAAAGPATAADAATATGSAGACWGLSAVSLCCRDLPLAKFDYGRHELNDDEEMRRPPDLALLARLGGCPPAGSPAAQKQRALAVFVLAEWLPVLLTASRRGALARMRIGCLRSSKVRGAIEAVQIQLHWIGVAARECLHAAAAAGEQREGPSNGGCGAHGAADVARARADSWRQLLTWESGACSSVVLWTGQLLEAAHPSSHYQYLASLLPACLDVLELLVCAVPGWVAATLQAPIDSWTDTCAVKLRAPGAAAALLRHGRGPLLEALQQLAGLPMDSDGRAPGWQPPEPLRVHLRSPPPGLGPGQPPLPAPCEVTGLLPRCGYPACVSYERDSEADLVASLRACGRCRAVAYCSLACQRAHWAAAHRAKCSGGGSGAKGAGASGSDGAGLQ